MSDALSDRGVGSQIKVAACARRSLMLYAELRREFINSGPRSVIDMWKLYPKMHLLLHVVEDQVLTAGSPVECWCYADETEIGAAVRVAESCHPSTLHRTVIQKHRLG